MKNRSYLKFIKLTISITCAFLVHGVAYGYPLNIGGDIDRAKSDLINVVINYADAVENNHFETLYNLSSAQVKKNLRSDHGIDSPEEYKSFALSKAMHRAASKYKELLYIESISEKYFDAVLWVVYRFEGSSDLYVERISFVQEGGIWKFEELKALKVRPVKFP